MILTWSFREHCLLLSSSTHLKRASDVLYGPAKSARLSSLSTVSAEADTVTNDTINLRLNMLTRLIKEDINDIDMDTVAVIQVRVCCFAKKIRLIKPYLFYSVSMSDYKIWTKPYIINSCSPITQIARRLQFC